MTKKGLETPPRPPSKGFPWFQKRFTVCNFSAFYGAGTALLLAARPLPGMLFRGHNMCRNYWEIYGESMVTLLPSLFSKSIYSMQKNKSGVGMPFSVCVLIS
jgi:hypothetical protein